MPTPDTHARSDLPAPTTLVPMGVVFAYIDPGSGSVLLQMLVGFALGTIFALGVFFRRVRSFVGRLFRRARP